MRNSKGGRSRGEGKKRKKYMKEVFAINTHYCRSELETIQHVLRKCGFAETTAGGNLYWFGLAMLDKDVKFMGKKKKKKAWFNRYPGLEQLCQKKIFCAINNRMRKSFPKIMNILPISFLVPEEADQLKSYME